MKEQLTPWCHKTMYAVYSSIYVYTEYIYWSIITSINTHMYILYKLLIHITNMIWHVSAPSESTNQYQELQWWNPLGIVIPKQHDPFCLIWVPKGRIGPQGLNGFVGFDPKLGDIRYWHWWWVVDLPLWKIYESQLGWWNSQLCGKWKT